MRQSGYFYLRGIIYLKEDEATGSFESEVRIEKKKYYEFFLIKICPVLKKDLFFLFCFKTVLNPI